jgi:type VI secretion system protein ImpC
MPERSSVGFEVDFQTKTAAVETREAEPFRIAVFGDFSGRANRGVADDARAVRPIRIDRDNFDGVLEQMAPALDVALGDGAKPMRIPFISLDEFHPDSLFGRLPLFEKLRELRKRLSDPATVREAAASASVPAPPPDLAALTGGGSLLDRMLEEQAAAEAPRRPARPGDLQSFINQVTAGWLVPGKDPEQQDLLARTDAAIAEQMRSLLHHPDFQALEAVWRALFFLVRRMETGVDLQIHIFDISNPELRADLNRAKDLRATAFYRHVITNAQSEPWALLAGNYSFGAEAEDVEMLARIAMIAHQARAPFLAAALPGVLGCESLDGMPEPREWRPDPATAQFWQTLRELPEAPSIGLFLPRFLLRLPYGETTSAVEEFPFEEMPGAPAHEQYLWGNPAILGALLLGQAFSADGWRMRPGAVREIPRLPWHTYERDGQSVAQPCAEAWLSDRAAAAILARGIMPLVSARNSDSVLLVRFQSVADPPEPLAGRW